MTYTTKDLHKIRDDHGKYTFKKGFRYRFAQAFLILTLATFGALIVHGLLTEPVAGTPVHAGGPALAAAQGEGDGEGIEHVRVNCARGKQGLSCDLTEGDVAEKAEKVSKWYGSLPVAAQVKPVQSGYHLPATGFRKLTGERLKVAEKVVALAGEAKFADVGYLLALADCESSFDPKASNVHGNKPSWSKDRGLYMYNSHWQKKVPDACAYDLTCATKTTIENLKAGRHSLWACDKVIRADGRLKAYRGAFNR